MTLSLAFPVPRPHRQALMATALFVAIAWLIWPSFPDAVWLSTLALGVILGIVIRYASARTVPAPGRERWLAERTEWVPLWCAWTGAGLLAGGIGFGLTLGVPGGLLVVFYGLIMALPQGWLLRSRLRGGGRWVLVTAACWPLAALMSLAFLYLAGPLGPLAGGLLIGVAQWLILGYGNALPRAGWWVVASMAAWAVNGWILCGAALCLPTDLASLPGGTPLGVGLVIGAAGGAAYGAISGAALLWLLHEDVPRSTRAALTISP